MLDRLLAYERVTSGRYSVGEIADAGEREVAKTVPHFARLSERFDITNVADRVARDTAYDVREMPNVVPPFYNTWMEWGLSGRFSGMVMSALISRQELDEEIPGQGVTFRSYLFAVAQPHDVWFVGADVFLSGEGSTHGPCGRWEWFARADGTIGGPDRAPYWMDHNARFGTPPFSQSESAEALIPILVALSLMRCDNVDTVQAEAKRSRAERRRGDQRGACFKRLIVRSVNSRMASLVPMSKPGATHRHHICRGHFKDYRNGGGLFGKYKGLYWWDEQARGDAERGVVVKDYEVRP